MTGATISGILSTAENTILRPFISVLIIFAAIVFIWGLIKFIWSAGDTKKSAEGKQLMLWGIIGLFVIVAMWGLVEVLRSTFSLTEQKIPGTSDVPKP